VGKDCRTWQLKKEDASDCNKWKKLIKVIGNTNKDRERVTE